MKTSNQNPIFRLFIVEKSSFRDRFEKCYSNIETRVQIESAWTSDKAVDSVEVGEDGRTRSSSPREKKTDDISLCRLS